MTPILSKSLESESAACIPPQIMAVRSLAISSATTNGEQRFFSCGLQKRCESLKLHPRSAVGISRSGVKMGCGKRRLAKCVNSILTCLRLNFNLFEEGGGGGGAIGKGGSRATRKRRAAINRHYLWHPRTQLSQGFRGPLATVYIVGHENAVYAWTAVAEVQPPVLGCTDKRPYVHNGQLA